MTPTQIIKNALTIPFVDEDGDPSPWVLDPPLNDEEIAAFEARLPCPLPEEIRELLSFCRSFTGSAIEIDFAGSFTEGWGAGAFLPHNLTLAADGFGNSWVLDLLPSSTKWGPIYYDGHDPPLFLYQSPDFCHFLDELVKFSTPPHQSVIDDIHEDRLFKVYPKNPFALSQQSCAEGTDPELHAFASELDEAFQIFDLRHPQIGMGFTWNLKPAAENLKRFGDAPIFAVRNPPRKPGLLKRLFGR